MKVLIIGGGNLYRNLFEDLGYQIADYAHEADLVCFTGGHDVGPHLYGEPTHPLTRTNDFRDAQEFSIFNALLRKKLPMVGICRGGQFLNVMSGGKMYQDCSNHTQAHPLYDATTGHMLVDEATSTHHQMMLPSAQGQILAVAHEGAKVDKFVRGRFMTTTPAQEAEVVYYEHTRSLCFQPHPEFGGKALREYFGSLVKTLLLS